MREAVPVEGAERSVFEPLQLSAVRDPADGVERGAEPGEEVGGETFRVCAIGRKQKDVVLAGAGGGPDVRICCGRNPLGIDGGADARTLHDVADVRRQSVRNIHHGMYFVPLAEPDAFGDLRPGIAVYGSGGGVVTARENVAQARPGGSECSRRENHVARDALRCGV